jgi:DNA-binding transcriptional MocR family regulator
MTRIYMALKAQIMEGSFAPGDRLDPTRIAHELSSSMTPVREALHRLNGERIVESWQQEGFRVPLVSEAMLRDLYLWSLELMKIAIRAAGRARSPVRRASMESGDVRAFGALLMAIAERSPNFEHRAAIANLNDRSEPLRAAEFAVVGDGEIVDLLAQAADRGAMDTVQALLTRFYRARLRAVVDIAAMSRGRQG